VADAAAVAAAAAAASALGRAAHVHNFASSLVK
jgi:hypothetical protein